MTKKARSQRVGGRGWSKRQVTGLNDEQANEMLEQLDDLMTKEAKEIYPIGPTQKNPWQPRKTVVSKGWCSGMQGVGDHVRKRRKLK